MRFLDPESSSRCRISTNVSHNGLDQYCLLIDRDVRRSLKSLIAKERAVDHAGVLERNFEMAKGFIRVSKDWKVDVLDRDRFSGKDQIMLCLIRGLYAKEG